MRAKLTGLLQRWVVQRDGKLQLQFPFLHKINALRDIHKETSIVCEPPKKDTVLGRWNLEYCDQKLNRKIELANEDHCGPCGNYKMPKKYDGKDL